MFTAWINSRGKEFLRKAGDTDFVADAAKGDVAITPGEVFHAVYQNVRVGNYSLSEKDDHNIAEVTAADADGIKVDHKNGWYYRELANDTTPEESKDRVSLNVHADPKLIEKLDRFCIQYKADYKTSDNLTSWLRRHDPVTIYFRQDITPSMEKDLARIVGPHVRGGHLLGKRIAKGIYREETPSLKEVNALIKRAEKLDPVLGLYVHRYSTNHHSMWHNDRPVRKFPSLSPGMKRTVEIILDSYEQFLAEQKAHKSGFRNRHLAGYDWEISSYNGTQGKMLHMKTVDPAEVPEIEELLKKKDY